LAPGAFANFLNLLKRKLLVNIKGETTIWVKVNAAEAHRLAKLPSLLYEIAEPEIQNIYLVRPLQYPDGEFYLKMGANLSGDLFFNNLEDIQDWFKIGNSNKNFGYDEKCFNGHHAGACNRRLLDKKVYRYFHPAWSSIYWFH